jgi:hypothetical protein
VYGLFIRIMSWLVFLPMTLMMAAPLPFPMPNQREPILGTWRAILVFKGFTIIFEDHGIGHVVYDGLGDDLTFEFPIAWRLKRDRLWVQNIVSRHGWEFRLEYGKWKGQCADGSQFELIERITMTYTR